MTQAAIASVDPHRGSIEAAHWDRSCRSVGPGSARARTTARSRRLAIRVVAVSVAALYHLAIVLIVGLSLQRSELRFHVVGGGSGALLASLTRSSDLSFPPSRRSQTAVDDLARVLGEAATTVPQPSRLPAHGSDVLAALDQASSPATSKTTRAEPATAHEPRDKAAVLLGSAENPWAHASAAVLDVDKTQELWAAVKRCWRGEVDEGRASIRVVLDSQGDVQSMSAMSEGGQAKSAAEALAAAVDACAPYHVGSAGAYLVTGPI